MHGREKDYIKTAKPQKGEVIVLLQSNRHGGVVLHLVGFGFCEVFDVGYFARFFYKKTPLKFLAFITIRDMILGTLKELRM